VMVIASQLTRTINERPFALRDLGRCSHAQRSRITSVNFRGIKLRKAITRPDIVLTVNGTVIYIIYIVPRWDAPHYTGSQ